MLTFRHTFLAPLAQRSVYRLLADFTAINRWDPRARDAALMDGDGGVGSTFACQAYFLGRFVTMRYVITDLAPPSRIEWTGRSDLVRAHDTICVSEHGPDVTEVSYEAKFEYPRLPTGLDRLLALPLRGLCNDARQGLERTLRQEVDD